MARKPAPKVMLRQAIVTQKAKEREGPIGECTHNQQSRRSSYTLIISVMGLDTCMQGVHLEKPKEVTRQLALFFKINSEVISGDEVHAPIQEITEEEKIVSDTRTHTLVDDIDEDLWASRMQSSQVETEALDAIINQQKAELRIT